MYRNCEKGIWFLLKTSACVHCRHIDKKWSSLPHCQIVNCLSGTQATVSGYTLGSRSSTLIPDSVCPRPGLVSYEKGRGGMTPSPEWHRETCPARAELQMCRCQARFWCDLIADCNSTTDLHGWLETRGWDGRDPSCCHLTGFFPFRI